MDSYLSNDVTLGSSNIVLERYMIQTGANWIFKGRWPTGPTLQLVWLHRDDTSGSSQNSQILLGARETHFEVFVHEKNDY